MAKTANRANTLIQAVIGINFGSCLGQVYTVTVVQVPSKTKRPSIMCPLYGARLNRYKFVLIKYVHIDLDLHASIQKICLDLQQIYILVQIQSRSAKCGLVTINTLQTLYSTRENKVFYIFIYMCVCVKYILFLNTQNHR